MNFVAIDFETANEKRDSACSVGLVKVKNGEIEDVFHQLIKPADMRFSRWNTRVHGITKADVEDAPSFQETVPKILEMTENELVVAHNASFADLTCFPYASTALKLQSTKGHV